MRNYSLYSWQTTPRANEKLPLVLLVIQILLATYTTEQYRLYLQFNTYRFKHNIN